MWDSTMKARRISLAFIGVIERFWDMFIIDALIGNTDRNNSNWGIVLRKDGLKEMASVYDNGNCLNNKWDDEKMQIVMSDVVMMEAEAYKARRCIFELHGRRVNPYHIMESMEYPECSDAIRRLVPGIGGCMARIRTMIKEMPILSEVQKQFFTLIIEYRYEKVLLPVYRKIIQRDLGDCEQKKGKCR